MNKITVFYDGQCPICLGAVERCRRLLPRQPIHWFDITGQSLALRELGIDPAEALIELHAQTTEGRIIKGIDSYCLLLQMMPQWYYRWLAILLTVKPIRKLAAAHYRRSTLQRLTRQGRYPYRCECP